MDEVGGAIDGVHNPVELGTELGLGLLLGNEACLGEYLGQLLNQQFFAQFVHLGHKVVATFGLYLHLGVLAQRPYLLANTARQVRHLLGYVG